MKCLRKLQIIQERENFRIFSQHVKDTWLAVYDNKNVQYFHANYPWDCNCSEHN